MKNRYAVFIITHGRANRQLTYKYFSKRNCTDDVYLIIDDKDEQLNEYKSKYKEKVIVFSKGDYKNKVDTLVNNPTLAHPVYARNAVYDIAKQLGYRYFFVVDDDIKRVVLRYVIEGNLKSHVVNTELRYVLNYLVDFMIATKAHLVGIPNVGAFIGGINSHHLKSGCIREVNNFYLCDTNKKIDFISTLHDDITTNLMLNNKGYFIISPMLLMQKFDTNGNEKGGGMKDTYDKYGLYPMVFSAVVVAPNSIKVKPNKDSFEIRRKNRQYPLIISDKYKKG